MTPWNILLVDDEEDVHAVSVLALKRKAWRNRSFQITKAYSAEEAKRILSEVGGEYFQVALVDVVMETNTAGLELCDFIRKECAASMRIVLRTGQPGAAPEEQVLNEYDIDYYLAKPEVTSGKLYAVIRACLRSSQDIATLLAFSRQLRGFTEALRNVTSTTDLLVFMDEGLKFLESKYGAKIQFMHDLLSAEHVMEYERYSSHSPSPDAVEALRLLHARNQTTERELFSGEEYGLSAGHYILPFSSAEALSSDHAEDDDTISASADDGSRGGVIVEFTESRIDEKSLGSFVSDGWFFIENWLIAFSTVRLQERVARERMLKEQMYLERVEGIANMVAGVAHEINTPLGVANTANSIVKSSAERLANGQEEPAIVAEELTEACDLLSTNLVRAHDLVRTFKQLSTSQLSDRRAEVILQEVVRDCVHSLSPETRKQGVEVQIDAPSDHDLRWDGFPGHLSQVIINLVQNAMRYAYPNRSGVIDIRLRERDASGLRVEVQDYGDGIPEESRASIFQAFFTTGRSVGGTGLGLAIVENIVQNLLSGRIRCQSEVGVGTTFAIDLPKQVPESSSASSQAS